MYLGVVVHDIVHKVAADEAAAASNDNTVKSVFTYHKQHDLKSDK